MVPRTRPSVEEFHRQCRRLTAHDHRRWRRRGVRSKFCRAFAITNLVGFSANIPVINLTISASTNNYNLYSAAGSPTYPVVVTCTINASVVVGSASTASYAFETGSAWSSGSRLALINNGSIHGCGGAGGAGGYARTNITTEESIPVSGDFSGTTAASSGGAGGPALRAQFAITITNNGDIRGAGGGGGGGGAGGAWGNGGAWAAGGGGGGGGRGTNGAGGGAGGGADIYVDGLHSIGSEGNAAVDGSGGGTSSASGAAGGGGGGLTAQQFDRAVQGGSGASGGDWGTVGGTGGTASEPTGQGIPNTNYNGGASGGAAGAATNGSATHITWAVEGTRSGTVG
jgi:hypothetical protein